MDSEKKEEEERSYFEKEHLEKKKQELEKERKFWGTQPVLSPKEPLESVIPSVDTHDEDKIDLKV